MHSTNDNIRMVCASCLLSRHKSHSERLLTFLFVWTSSSLICVNKHFASASSVFVNDASACSDANREKSKERMCSIKHSNDRNGVLLCFRSDLEKVLDSSLVGEIKHSLKQQDIPFFETDTVLPANIPIDQRNSELNRKLSQFQTSKLVITDRLHGMLFAAITGTPCIALDNVSKKVSGAYNWIKTEENILCLQDDQSDTASIIKTINQFYKTAVPNYEIDINSEFLNLKKIIGDIL